MQFTGLRVYEKICKQSFTCWHSALKLNNNMLLPGQSNRDNYSQKCRYFKGYVIIKPRFRSLKLNFHRIVNSKTVVLDGVRINASKDWVPKFVQNLLFNGTYEYAERKMLKSILRPGHRVLEIGCGIGVVGTMAAKIAGAENVLSYEANPAQYSVIKANYKLNNLFPELRMKAITKDGKPVTFYQNANVISSSVYERDGETHKMIVKSDPFDAVVAEFCPDVIVMDVEGAEVDLLINANFGSVKFILVELHRKVVGDGKIDLLLAELKNRNFSQIGYYSKNALFKKNADS